MAMAIYDMQLAYHLFSYMATNEKRGIQPSMAQVEKT